MRPAVISSLAGLCLLLLWPTSSPAKIVDGLVCGLCHTMHNSQKGTSMVAGGGGPITGLLRNTCIGCHTGNNPDGSGMAIPFVLDSNGTDLAGGNFYFMQSDLPAVHSLGHNVVGLNSSDATHSFTPPGGSGSSQLVCAGTNGCHGETLAGYTNEVSAMRGTHHDGANPIITGFRLLKGITGVEAADWEYSPTANSHNQYKGDTGGPPGANTDTITAVCERCHGNFHTVAEVGSTSPWLRHPSDVALPGSSEYVSYNKNGGVSGEYNTIVPVASSTGSSVVSMPTGSNAIVTCITCHRAHASGYDSIMRWDYKNWPGGGYAGCQVCHSSKD